MKKYFKNIFSKKDKLNAGWAFFASATYCFGVIVGFAFAYVAVLGFALIDPNRTTSLDFNTSHYYVKSFEQPIFLFGHIMGLVYLVILAKRIFPDFLKDRSMTGAAWVAGKAKDNFMGIFIGVILAILYFYISSFFNGNSPDTERLWQWAEKGAYFKVTIIILIINSIIMFPLAEELMFRGIILAGFNRSFGLIWGCILTTILFISIHGSSLERLNFQITILCISIAFLLIRLKTGAIGPAIALHSTYNLVNLILNEIY